jgi:hypothetical protein
MPWSDGIVARKGAKSAKKSVEAPSRRDVSNTPALAVASGQALQYSSDFVALRETVKATSPGRGPPHSSPGKRRAGSGPGLFTRCIIHQRCFCSQPTDYPSGWSRLFPPGPMGWQPYQGAGFVSTEGAFEHPRPTSTPDKAMQCSGSLLRAARCRSLAALHEHLYPVGKEDLYPSLVSPQDEADSEARVPDGVVCPKTAVHAVGENRLPVYPGEPFLEGSALKEGDQGLG